MIKKSLAIIVLAMLGAGCVQTPPRAPINSETKTVSSFAWTDAGDGVSRYECAPPACAARLVIYRFPKNAFSWHFINLPDKPQTAAGFISSLPGALFVVNGVYFDEQKMPTGLLISRGKPVNKKRYEDDRTAVLELAPEFRIIDTAKEKIDESKLIEAAQSYPLLIKNGAVQKVAAEKKARRTFVGTDTDGKIYFGVISDDEVTLAEMASLVDKTGVAWDMVLNLDGGPSTGLATSLPASNEIINSIVQVPNAIVAEKK